MPTKIQWATETWNVVTGCTPISEGCQNCYAERMAKRLAGRCGYDKDNPFKVTTHSGKLVQPLRWKKPRMIFVCSMGDLFHADVPEWRLDEVFGIMLACLVFNNVPIHKFMVLTKRPEKMREYLMGREPREMIRAWAVAAPCYTDDEDVTFEDLVHSATCHDWDENGRNSNGSEYKPWAYISNLWPLPNVWLGVTAENQQRADERIPILLQIPADKRFVSLEPLLGPVELGLRGIIPKTIELTYTPVYEKIDWVIAGCETGPKARQAQEQWFRNLKNECQDTGVPFFLKQMMVDGKLVKMPELDGKVWAEFPKGAV